MQIEVSGHQFVVTQALRDYAVSKLDRIVRHFDQLQKSHVILSVRKLEHKAEANIHVSGKDFHAEAIADDMYAAIDQLTDKLDNQVRRHKEKITNHHRGSDAIAEA